MELAQPQEWQSVDRAAFLAWLQQFDTDEPMGMAGGWTNHPISAYLNHRDGGLWCVEVTREYVRLLNRNELHPCFHIQRGWLVAFCRELKKPDAYRTVTAIQCIAALMRVMEE